MEADKLGSATSPLGLSRTVAVTNSTATPKAGDVIAVRTLTDSATYNMLELPTGRLAKINPGDVIIGVLGRRRALKGFVGDVPQTSMPAINFICSTWVELLAIARGIIPAWAMRSKLK